MSDGSTAAVSPRSEPSPQEVFLRSTLALFVAFLPLAFSEDLIGFTVEQSGSGGPGFLLLAVDFLLYALIAWILWPVGSYRHPSKSRRLFVQSLILMMAIDLAVLLGVFDWVPPLGNLFAVAFWMVPMVFLYRSIALAQLRHSPGIGIWVVGGPLLVGTAITWVLSVLLWPGLESAALGYEDDQGRYFAEPRVNQEYFAQVSQLLPVLLIALAIELRFFRGASGRPSVARLARSAVVAGIVVAGTFAAVVSLLRPDSEEVLNNFSLWAEYFAYELTINAVAVAVVALMWALLSDEPLGVTDSQVRQVADE